MDGSPLPAAHDLQRSLRNALPHALALALLAGCAQPPPPASDGDAASVPTAPAAPAPALRCMPTALVTLKLPLSEGFALAQAGEPANASTVDCVLSLFGHRPLKSPVAFDRAYAPVFAFHEEDGTRTLASLPRDALRLFRVGDVGGASTWLLRVDTGMEMEGSRYDALFTTDRAGGALVDQLLVGAMGVMYRRDYDIDAADAFAIREDTGREDTAGPGYRARYRVMDDGRFALVSGQALPAPGAETAADVDTGEPLSGISLETLPGAFGALAPIRALLFDGGDVEEKAIVRVDAGRTPLMLAIGQTQVAGVALYVLAGVPGAGGGTHYRVSGLALDAPAGAVSADLRGHRWQVDDDGRARIALSLRYGMPRPGGDPATGEPETMAADVERVALYDPETGALVSERAD